MPVLRNKFVIYTLSGFMSGLAGWVFVSRVSTTRQDMGTGWELTAITAVVVGGTSIFGGSGTIVGTSTSHGVSGVVEVTRYREVGR